MTLILKTFLTHQKTPCIYSSRAESSRNDCNLSNPSRKARFEIRSVWPTKKEQQPIGRCSFLVAEALPTSPSPLTRRSPRGHCGLRFASAGGFAARFLRNLVAAPPRRPQAPRLLRRLILFFEHTASAAAGPLHVTPTLPLPSGEWLSRFAPECFRIVLPHNQHFWRFSLAGASGRRGKFKVLG